MDATHATDEARRTWNARHADRSPGAQAARFLTDRAPLLPVTGRALDVAGGTGRNALWLAARGLQVTLVDVSDVAAERAREAAVAAGVPLEVVRREVTPGTLPSGPFEVVLVHHFLDRAVWAALLPTLAPGGVALLCQPTVRNLERHPRPSRRWLLEEGEVLDLAAAATAADPGLTVIEASEGWTDEDRHEAHLVLRRSPQLR